ncbi:TPA: hypothetical protein U1C31_001306 [Streptococcus suis]|nr:hypothetical protein [Streptococcus suis]
MKSITVDDYIDSVVELDVIDDSLIEVIRLIPDRFFYEPEIGQEEYVQYRRSIQECIQKSKFRAYFNDASLKKRIKRLAREYEIALRCLAMDKKSELGQSLIYLDNHTKLTFLYQKILDHRLLPYLIGEVD